jgi:aminoglycoside phosphotransferase (APT) family kinase protein
MLAAAGFAASRFYWPYPDYREFRRIVDADDRRWLAESFAPVSRRGRLAHRLYRRMPVLRHIIPSFAVIAGAHPVPPSYLDRLKAALVARGDLQADAAVASYRVTGTGTVQVVLRDREAWFLTLPLDRNGLMRIARDVRMRRRFAYLPLPPPQAGQINHLRAGEFQDLMYKLESFCTGTRRPDAPPEQSESFYLACVRWLVEFQQSGAVTVPLPLTEDQLPGVEESRRLVLETLSPAARVRWEALTAQLAAAPRRAAPLHGDFHRGNVLLDPTGAVVRVVDWDLAVSVGPPVWDLMRLRGHDLFESAGLPWCEAYRQGVRALVDIPAPSVASHVVALGLTRADLWYGALTYPLFQLRNKMRYGDKRAQVILAGLGPVLEDVVRQAEAERQAGEMR